MLRSIHEMFDYTLAAKDGEIGTVDDFLFDEQHWTVRWLVAETGTWLPERKVLVSPVALGEPDWAGRAFPVHLTIDEIKGAPPLDVDAPVSRAHEVKWYDFHAWPYYWTGGRPWGTADVPDKLRSPREGPISSREGAGELFFPREGNIDTESGGGQMFMPREQPPDAIPAVGEVARERAPAPPVDVDRPEEDQDTVLRSTKEVLGYRVHAADGEIGHLHDAILDEAPWTYRYFVVDLGKWIPDRKVLIAPDWLTSIDWKDEQVHVDHSCEAIRNSPEYDSTSAINRKYEELLFDYYGRPAYW